MLTFPKRAAFVLLSTLLLTGFEYGCKTSNFSSQPTARVPKPKVVAPSAPGVAVNPIKANTLAADAFEPTFDSTLDSETWTLDASGPAEEPEPPKPGPVVVTPQPSPKPAPIPAPMPGPLPEPKFNNERETFTQHGISGKVDLLIVVDNSNSMREEQKNLSDKLGALIGALKDADWQIGIVTTTVKSDENGDKCEMTLVKSNEKDLHNRFASAVQPGITGDVNEQGIRAAVAGLRCRSKPWLRDNSTVAVLILSDEDNCSNGKGCDSSPAKTDQFLIDFVENDLHRTVGKNAGFYGIFAPPGERCRTAGNTANIYSHLVKYNAAMQKNYGNICDPSYQATLEQISKNIAKLLTSQFKLKQKPFPGSVVITGRKSDNSAVNSSDYSVNDDVISFNPGNEPALESEIIVTYKIKGN